MTLSDFLGQSPSEYQAVSSIKKELLAHGFKELREEDAFSLGRGDYFVTRNDSALIAFTVPEEFDRIRITAAHTDSPYFKIKENPEIRSNGYVKLNVEKYGGMLESPWLDRPLSIAGRIFTDEDGIKMHLVNLDRPVCLIPSLAIHMDRNANNGKKFNPQNDLLPLYSCSEDGKSLISLVADSVGADEDSVIGFDLYCVNYEKPVIWGDGNEFISSPRLDDLQSVYGTLAGFLKAKRSLSLSVFAVFSNEEVGSSTRQGAASTFLADTLKRIYLSLGKTFEDYERDLARGFMISADNAHAIHPNSPEKADPVNRPLINHGVVMKFSGNQKYCTDGYSAAVFRKLAKEAGKEIQVFTNRSDIPGGSTLGNISNNQVAIPTVDIGLPMLAMHSPFETAGTKDTDDLAEIISVFFK